MLSSFRVRAPLGRGGVVFLSGSPGSGRTALLDRLRAELRALESPPAVALARLRAIRAEPKTLDPALGVLAGSLGLLGATVAQPVLGLIGTVVSVSNAARKLALAARDAEQHALDLAARILRAAAEERPLVLLIDDAEQIEGSWWSDLVQGFASEIARDLPLFVVMTVDGPDELGDARDGEPDWLPTARRLVEHRIAEWRPVGLVTADQVQEWIGSVSGETVRRLVELTGGLATVTSEMWEDWRSLGIVELSERTSRWAFSAGYSDRIRRGAGDVVRRRLATLVADSGRRQQVYELLARAALEGRTFTPEAVVRAGNGVPDDVFARLSAITQTEKRPLGLVVEAAPAAVAERGAVPRYAFTSVTVWWSLQRYGLLPSEEIEVAAALAEGLLDVYGETHPLVVRALARLLDTAGEPERARHFRRIADHLLAKDVVTWQARQICDADRSEWDVAEIRRAMVLLESAVPVLQRTGPLSEGLAVTAVWIELARRAGDALAEGRARYQEACDLRACGRSSEAAEECDRLLPDLAATGNGAYEASTRQLLGLLHVDRGDYGPARELFEAAREQHRRTGDRKAEAVTRYYLADLDWRGGDKDAARAALAAIARKQDGLGDHIGATNTHFALGWMERADGLQTEARDRLREVLAERQETADRLGEARTRHELAGLAGDTGSLEEARSEAEVALRLRQRAGDGNGEAETLLLLAQLDRAEGDLSAAQAHTRDAVELRTAFERGRQQAAARFELGRLEYETGEFARAREQFAAVLEIRRELEDGAGQALAVEWLGAVAHRTGDYGSARDHYVEAIRLRDQRGERAAEANARNGLGRLEYKTGEFARAREQFTAVLEIHRELDDAPGEATAHSWLASAARMEADYEVARAHFRRAIEIDRTCGVRKAEADHQHGLGLTEWFAGDRPAAVTAYQRELALQRECSDRAGEARAQSRLGLVTRMEGDVVASLQHCRASIEAYQAVEDREGEALALWWLGLAEALAGDSAGARASFERWASLERDAGRRSGEVTARMQLGLLDIEAGELNRARRTFEAVIKSSRPDDPTPRGFAQNRLAEVLWLQGDLDRAREHLQAALEVLRIDDDAYTPFGMAVAVARHRTGMLRPSRVDLLAAERDWHTFGSRDVEAALVQQLGALEREAGRPQTAREHLTRALTLCQELGDPVREAVTRRELECVDTGSEVVSRVTSHQDR